MPTLRRIERTFPDLQQSGPLLDLTLEPTLETQALLQGEGQAIPVARLRALIDTGASGTIMQASLMAGFGLDPIGSVFAYTPSTTEPVVYSKYRVRLVFGNTFAVETDVAEAPMGGQAIQCLIGRDILQRAVLTYNGPKNRYTLNFPQVSDDD